MKNHVTGIRYLKGFDLKTGEEKKWVDVLMATVLEEGPQTVSIRPDKQFVFAFNPKDPKEIADSLRSLADKIQDMEVIGK